MSQVSLPAPPPSTADAGAAARRAPDRRRHRRYGIAPLSCRVGLHPGRVLDLSLVGLAVETEEPLAIGRRLPIEIALPEARLNFTVDVIRCRLVGFRERGLDRLSVYHSGLDFRHEIDTRAPELLALITDHVLLTDLPVDGFLRTARRGGLGRVETCSVLRLGARRARVATGCRAPVGSSLGLTLRRGAESLSASSRILLVESGPAGRELELAFEPLTCTARLTLRQWIRDVLE